MIVGPNASGKTNLLEAVMVVCSGKSYRAPDGELINHAKTWARIDAETESGTRSVKLTKGPKTLKEFVLNNKTYKRLSLANQLPVVLFEPNHLLMLSGSPELRRNYVDAILDTIKPGYKKTRSDYLRTLKQRNYLLKSGRATKNNLFPWNVRLSHLGGLIAISRAELTDELNKNISNVYCSLSNKKEKISLNYKPAARLDLYETDLLNKLESSLEQDRTRGFTTNGPHREDLEILINNKPTSYAASRGETRTITIALKTLESEMIKKQLDRSPVILLDDVFSELDERRTRQLAVFLTGHQSIITATDNNDFNSLGGGHHIIKTVHGLS